jgi:PPOX class probable FMN-dependent enzyme
MQNFSSTTINDTETLRQIYDKPPVPGALRKCLDHLDMHARQFISLSPFLVLATSDGSTSADVSPRGGAPGHVAVADDKHLLLPDRSGNNWLDSFHNILRFPYVGLLFIIPGVSVSLRVNGRASICTCADLLRHCGGERPPKAGLLIEVSEMFLHCPRAFDLASVWQPASWPDARELPSAGKIWSDHIWQSPPRSARTDSDCPQECQPDHPQRVR